MAIAMRDPGGDQLFARDANRPGIARTALLLRNAVDDHLEPTETVAWI